MNEEIQSIMKGFLIGLWPFYVFLAGILAILFLEIFIYRMMKPWIAKKDKPVVNFLFRFFLSISLFMVLGIFLACLANRWQTGYWYVAGLVLVFVGFIVMAIIFKNKYFKRKG